MSINKPTPTLKEIRLDPEKIIVSKTDTKGIILYGNDYFCEISGYKESELISSNHNIIRHPDMPRTLFYLMWEHLNAGRSIVAIVKNMAKNGDFYWVVTDFEIKRDITGDIKYFVAYRKSAPRGVIPEVEKLYATLREIEKEHGLKAGVVYFESFLEEKNMNYDQFIENLIKSKDIKNNFLEKMKSWF